MSEDLARLATEALCAELEELRDSLRQITEPLTDEEFWRRPIDPGNSVGHLVLHLTGNLRHFVGAQLGQSGYIRNREREFTALDVPGKAEALAGLDEAVVEFRRVVSGLTAEQLAAPHPEPRLKGTLKALIHLVAHFALHRGQISYLVRLV